MLPEPLQQIERTQVRYRGRKLAYFGGCDYFRMASHPEVLEAVRDGIFEVGLNVAASRVTTGNHRLYGQLEKALEKFFRVESALIASNGYLPNLLVAQALASNYSHAFVDERIHSSLRDAAGMLDCKILSFAHRDPSELRRAVNRLGRNARPILLTDGVFSHDGSIAPLREYLGALNGCGPIVVDDAHGTAVLGKNGRGTAEYWNLDPKNFIQTITLSKAFGVYGGAVLGRKDLIQKIVRRSRAFAGNTPLPLPLVVGALKSVEILARDKTMRNRLRANTQWVRAAISQNAPDQTDSPAPIISVVPDDQHHAAKIRRRLVAHSVFPSLIRYTGGPKSGYFRFAISSEHTRSQLEALALALSF